MGKAKRYLTHLCLIKGNALVKPELKEFINKFAELSALLMVKSMRDTNGFCILKKEVDEFYKEIGNNGLDLPPEIIAQYNTRFQILNDRYEQLLKNKGEINYDYSKSYISS